MKKTFDSKFKARVALDALLRDYNQVCATSSGKLWRLYLKCLLKVVLTNPPIIIYTNMLMKQSVREK